MNTLRFTFLVLFLTSFTVLMVSIGFSTYGAIGGGAMLAMMGIINFCQYYYCDKLVVWMTGAVPAKENEYPHLHRMLSELAENAGIPKPRLFLVPSPVPNAFATGRNPENGLVALNTGIVELLDVEELKGVVAHELAHIKNYDTLIASVVATIVGLFQYMSRMFFWGSYYRDRDKERNPLEIIFIIIAPIMAVIVQLAISRTREFEADRRGAQIAGSPKGLINALKKLELTATQLPKDIQLTAGEKSTAHMYIYNPFSGGYMGWFSKLFSTHPPTEERIKMLESYNGNPYPNFESKPNNHSDEII